MSQRTIRGWERYSVDDRGVVYSKRRPGAKGGPLKPRPDKDGYLTVMLYGEDGRRQNFQVHKLVLEAFAGERPSGMWARHIGESKTDNRWPEAICWDTISENHRDQVRQGTHPWASKTHCPSNHAYDAENTYIRPSDGARMCRACHRK